MEAKEKVGITAADYIKDGMIVGLGTGSTAYYFVKEIGRRLRENELNIKGAVVTSEVTRLQAVAEGIPLLALNEIDEIDVIVDGTDEFDPQLNGIKGGGGALLVEKIVAINSKQVIWIADERKRVNKLGQFPLPVEIIKTGAKQLIRRFETKGYHPVLRLDKSGLKPYLTDEGNYIIDLHMNVIEDVKSLAAELESTVGLVEHGLFIDIADMVIISNGDGVEVINS